MRHVHLDPIGAVIELFARSFPGFHGTVDDLRALGHLEFGGVTLEHVTRSRGNGASGDEKSRARHIAQINCLLYAYITVSGAFRFDIAQAREALLQSSARRHTCAQLPKRKALPQKLAP